MIDSFACFGSTCTVDIDGGDVAEARATLLSWHERFTRFDPASELSRFNADPRAEIPVTPLLARLTAAARWAAELSGGLVDATLLGDLERAGYSEDLSTLLDLREALARAPRRRAFAVDCAGDLRVGGRERNVHVRGPFEDDLLHTFRLADAGVATSGIGRRSWAGPDGRPAHHLLDPATGRPAYTGVVQATAIAPTALEAEVRAKAAVLSGPDGATVWLSHGGVVVYDEASFAVTPSMATAGRTSTAAG